MRRDVRRRGILGALGPRRLGDAMTPTQPRTPSVERMTDDEFDVWQQRGPWVDGDGHPATYRCAEHENIGRFYECAQCGMQQAHRAEALLNEARRARASEAALTAELERLRAALTEAQEAIMAKMRVDAVALEGAGKPPQISFHLTRALSAIHAALRPEDSK
jgi:hypothetical protein